MKRKRERRRLYITREPREPLSINVKKIRDFEDFVESMCFPLGFAVFPARYVSEYSKNLRQERYFLDGRGATDRALKKSDGQAVLGRRYTFIPQSFNFPISHAINQRKHTLQTGCESARRSFKASSAQDEEARMLRLVTQQLHQKTTLFIQAARAQDEALRLRLATQQLHTQTPQSSHRREMGV